MTSFSDSLGALLNARAEEEAFAKAQWGWTNARCTWVDDFAVVSLPLKKHSTDEETVHGGF